MYGFLDLYDIFDSCITATLTWFLSNITPSSVSLLPITLVFICRTLNVVSSLIGSLVGAGVGGGEGGECGGGCWAGGTEQGSKVQLLILRY